MRKRIITDEKVAEIKELLKKHGIRESGRIARVSFYTAYMVSKGRYDQDGPLVDKKEIDCFAFFKY